MRCGGEFEYGAASHTSPVTTTYQPERPQADDIGAASLSLIAALRAVFSLAFGLRLYHFGLTLTFVHGEVRYNRNPRSQMLIAP
jgi:hypothetical protein